MSNDLSVFIVILLAFALGHAVGDAGGFKPWFIGNLDDCTPEEKQQRLRYKRQRIENLVKEYENEKNVR